MPATAADFRPVDEQLALLRRGVVDLTTEDELRRKLERSRASRAPLTVKVGFDPTAPDLHLGHTVLLRKMRQFQDLGHRVVFVIGDFTGMIGDPTGRSKTRPPLSREEIEANADTYRRQCGRVLDPERTEVRFNREWLGALTSDQMIQLAARYNVARMLERSDFKQRFESGRSISVHEFLYPLVQAYDSVALRADVELGGTDQLFNLNVGRDIMPSYGLEPQIVMTTPLLEGLDGVDKMSKSLDNYVGIEEPARSMYGKLLSITDELMWRYYELATSVSVEAISRMRELVERGELHPKQAKEGLALRVISDFHGEDAARDAREEFERIFARHGEPDAMPEHVRPAGTFPLAKLIAELGLASSNGEALRLLRQGAVRLDGEKVEPGTVEIRAGAGEARVIKVGKRRFARVIFE
jgi:tyrosyl-tRNA synthetase